MIVRCPYCGSRLGVATPSRLVHHPDGSHTIEPVTIGPYFGEEA